MHVFAEIRNIVVSQDYKNLAESTKWNVEYSTGYKYFFILPKKESILKVIRKSFWDTLF